MNPKTPIGETRAEVVMDSLSTTGRRIITFRLEMPLIILPQFSKHRAFAFNTQSFRAVPTKRVIEQVPRFVPSFVRGGKGMLEGSRFDGKAMMGLRDLWGQVEMEASDKARWLAELGVAKGQANRLMTPFRYTRLILTALDDEFGLRNMFRLRLADDTQSEFGILARAMRAAVDASQPVQRRWHIPFVSDDFDGSLHERLSLSVSAVARESYRRNALDEREQRAKALEMWDRLSGSGHWSCFEHQVLDTHHEDTPDIIRARAFTSPESPRLYGCFWSSNCWMPVRKMIEANGAVSVDLEDGDV